MTSSDWWQRLNESAMIPIQGTVAFLGALVLLWYYLAERPATAARFRRYPRLRDAALVLTAALACLSWTNLGRFHFTTVYHYRELYHYYLGAKYADELGYSRLYECTVAAEAELGRFPQQLPALRMRDLNTNVLGGTSEILAHPERCTSHFTPERWRDFVHDADYFCQASSLAYWSVALADNGYNATPLWTLPVRLLTNALGPLDDAQLHALGNLDFYLLAAMWAAVGWAFGWRALAVCLLFWGTNYPARYWWTGGSLFRSDFLVFSALSLCLVARRRPFAGGVALGVAALLRVFPALIAVALVAKCVAVSIRARRLVVTAAQRRFFAGAAAAVLVLVPLSSLAGAGGSGWRGFIDNSKKHLATPLTNNMGLKAVIAYDGAHRVAVTRDAGAVDPFERWKRWQRETFDARRVLFVLAVAAYLALLAAAAARASSSRTSDGGGDGGGDGGDDWVALALGVGAILVCAQLTSYYLAIFSLFGLLWLRQRWIGCALVTAAWASCVIPSSLLRWDDDRYVAISALFLFVAVAATAALARATPTPATPPLPSPAPTPKSARAAPARPRGRRARGRRGG